MPTLNVGNLAAYLGIDQDKLIEGLAKTPGFYSTAAKASEREWLKSQKAIQAAEAETTRQMQQELNARVAAGKQAARIILTEGTGNFMLARLLSGALPQGVTGALSGVLGGVVTGAVGIGAIELIDKISEKMDKAKQKEEEYNEAVRHTKTVFEEAMDAGDRMSQKLQARLAGLRGDSNAEGIFKARQIDIENTDRLAKEVDKLVEAERRETKAGFERMTVWNALGKVWHQLWSSDAQLAVEKIDGGIKSFQESFADLSRTDGAAAVRLLNNELDRAKIKLDTMNAAAGVLITSPAVGLGGAPSSRLAVTPEEIKAQETYLATLQKIVPLKDKGDENAQFLKDIDRQEAANRAAAEAAREAARLAAEQKRQIEELGRAYEAATKKFDPDEEIERKLRSQIDLINRVFQQIGTGSFGSKFGISAGTMGQMFGADAELEKFENFMKRTGELIPGIAKVKGGLAGSPDLGGIGMPTLNDTGRVAALFDEFQRNAKEQDAFGKSLEKKGLDPGQNLQLYLLKLGSMKLSEEDLAAAKQKGMDAWVQETNAIDKQEKALERLMKRSDDASAGMQAFFTKFSKDSQENGRFAFQILDSSVKGFENSLAFAVTNGTRGWSQQWKNLAKQLEGQIFKFSLDKALVAGGHALGGTGIGQTISKVLGLGKDPAQAALVAAESANTAATIANTAALGFATVGKGASAGPGGAIGALIAQWGGGGGGGAAASTGGSFEGPFALGGSVGPGSSFIAGESGAEEISLGSSGGANIKPMGGGRGDVHNHYDFSGAVVTDDLLRKADAARMMSASENRGVARSVSMNQEIARRGRAR